MATYVIGGLKEFKEHREYGFDIFWLLTSSHLHINEMSLQNQEVDVKFTLAGASSHLP